MKRGKIALITFVFSIMLIGIVGASGVSSPYWEDNPLTMYKGETKIINLNLQNMVGNDDFTYGAEIREGAEVASLSQGVFVVKAHTSDTLVPLRISVPADAAIGDTTTVKVDFKTITSDTGGMVSMGVGMSVTFDVIVVEKPKTPLPVNWIVAGIVALVIIIWMVSSAGKKKRKRK